jgi:hypothetical protein
MNDNDTDLLAGWRSPPAPPELMQRVLAAARDHNRPPVGRRLEDRLWESRAVRFGWLAAATLLLALNLAVRNPAGAPVVASAEQPQRAGDAEIDVGAPIPTPADDTLTLAEAGGLVREILVDPCLDPMTEGDCS